MRRLGIWAVLGIWAGLCLGGALYATRQGYGGRGFGAMLTVFAFFLLVMLAFAARDVAEGWAEKFGPGGGFFLGGSVFVFYLVYLLPWLITSCQGAYYYTPIRVVNRHSYRLVCRVCESITLYFFRH